MTWYLSLNKHTTNFMRATRQRPRIFLGGLSGHSNGLQKGIKLCGKAILCLYATHIVNRGYKDQLECVFTETGLQTDPSEISESPGQDMPILDLEDFTPNELQMMWVGTGPSKKGHRIDGSTTTKTHEVSWKAAAAVMMEVVVVTPQAREYKDLLHMS